MAPKLKLYNVLDIGVTRIEIIEEERFRLTNNKHQLVLTPSDYCDKITGVQPYSKNLVQHIKPFDDLIPLIETKDPVGKTALVTKRSHHMSSTIH